MKFFNNNKKKIINLRGVKSIKKNTISDFFQKWNSLPLATNSIEMHGSQIEDLFTNSKNIK